LRLYAVSSSSPLRTRTANMADLMPSVTPPPAITAVLRQVTRIAMPIVAQSEFNCPSCSTLSTVEARGTVNAQEEPLAKKAIIDGSFFDHTCGTCGNKTRLIYNMLYIDPARRMMVCLVADGGLDAQARMMSAAKGLSYPDDFILRVVHSANDLREKILIFDESLDDRIVEIAKGNALSQLEPDIFVREIHFDLIGGQRVLTLFCKNGTESEEILYMTSFDTLYSELSERYESRLPALATKSFCVVNLDYAADFLQSIEK
jgi:hypothetical protein